MSNFSDVGDFHHKFGLHTSDFPNAPGPQPWNEALLYFRLKFLLEETQEFADGLAVKDHAQMFDALIDLVYVAMGTAHLLGYPWETGWKLVHHANMAKVRAAADGSDSKRGSSFDVVKPEGWTPPDIEGLLMGFGYTVQEPPSFTSADAPQGVEPKQFCPGCLRDMEDPVTTCYVSTPGQVWCSQKGFMYPTTP